MQRGISALIDQADEIIVRKDPTQESIVLFSSKKEKDRAELKKAAETRMSLLQDYCACLGSPAIYLYRNGKELAQITNHHGDFLRYANSWNLPVRDPQKWLGWFDARGIFALQQEYEDSLERGQIAKTNAERRWEKAMPISLRPFWNKMQSSWEPVGESDLYWLEPALKKEFPDRKQRILALLSWYGSGAGPWSGFPSYEGVACKLLMNYSTTDLLETIEKANLDESQTEGAARLFGGWDFRHTRPDDLQQLSPGLKAKLLAHVLSSGTREKDQDKLERAKSAFGA